jgi:hypothetical protein
MCVGSCKWFSDVFSHLFCLPFLVSVVQHRNFLCTYFPTW